MRREMMRLKGRIALRGHHCSSLALGDNRVGTLIIRNNQSYVGWPRCPYLAARKIPGWPLIAKMPSPRCFHQRRAQVTAGTRDITPITHRLDKGVTITRGSLAGRVFRLPNLTEEDVLGSVEFSRLNEGELIYTRVR